MSSVTSRLTRLAAKLALVLKAFDDRSLQILPSFRSGVPFPTSHTAEADGVIRSVLVDEYKASARRCVRRGVRVVERSIECMEEEDDRNL